MRVHLGQHCDTLIRNIPIPRREALWGFDPLADLDDQRFPSLSLSPSPYPSPSLTCLSS